MLPSLRNLLVQDDAQSALARIGLERSHSLDSIAKLAAAISGHDAAGAMIMDHDSVTPLGLSGASFPAFKRRIRDAAQHREYTYFDSYDAKFPESDLANGTYLKVKSAGFFRLSIANETIGALAIYAFRHRLAPSDHEVAALKRLAYIASELIRSKAELKMTLGNVFSLANR